MIDWLKEVCAHKQLVLIMLRHRVGALSVDGCRLSVRLNVPRLTLGLDL